VAAADVAVEVVVDVKREAGAMKHMPIRRAAAAFACVAALGAPLLAHAQAAYATPEQAADALIEAVVKDDTKAMAHVLGKDWRSLMPLGGVDPADRKIFVDKAREARTVKVEGKVAALAVGNDRWVLPIPVRQSDAGQWRFDVQGGRERVLERRIGLNERSAMLAALAYVDAQRDYALADRNKDGVLEYAQRFNSSPGKRDGLIWSTKLGDESPLGEAYVPARAGEGYHGYHFRILTGQGAGAPGGARSYLIGGRMVRGFALVAWPVQYDRTGVMSFLINQDGKLYERDLGPDTATAVAKIKVFDPTDWKPVAP
jgi:hypothetical protein